MGQREINKKLKEMDIIFGDDNEAIGKNKFDKAKVKISEGYKVYFFWLLQDGLYVYEVNKNQNFETTYLGNYARNDKSKELILIPNLVLKKTIPKEERTTEDKNKVEPYILKWD